LNKIQADARYRKVIETQGLSSVEKVFELSDKEFERTILNDLISF
jgi:hypothetical protein